MKIEIAASFTATVFISGDAHTARQLLRQECLREGLCVTVEETRYIYTGGEETGVRVGLLNYPRFPTTASEIHNRALKIAKLLLAGMHQHSVLVQSPLETLWMSNRDA